MIWVTDSLAQIHNRITTAELPAYHVSQTWAGVPLHAVSYDRHKVAAEIPRMEG